MNQNTLNLRRELIKYLALSTLYLTLLAGAVTLGWASIAFSTLVVLPELLPVAFVLGILAAGGTLFHVLVSVDLYDRFHRSKEADPVQLPPLAQQTAGRSSPASSRVEDRVALLPSPRGREIAVSGAREPAAEVGMAPAP